MDGQWDGEALLKGVLSALTGLPPDTLQGHRDRFLEQFKKYDTLLLMPKSLCPPPPHPPSSVTPPSFSCRIKSLFYRSSNLQYFKRLIQIPQLPEVRPQLFTGLSAAFFSCV